MVSAEHGNKPMKICSGVTGNYGIGEDIGAFVPLPPRSHHDSTAGRQQLMELNGGIDYAVILGLTFLAAWKLIDIGVWLHANGLLYIASAS